MVEQIFIQLAIVLSVAFILSLISKALKQPLILGYIIAGVILSPFIIQLGTTNTIQTLSEFGVAFLLFIVGLHMNPKSIKEVGIPALLIGLGQMIFTFAVGFLVSLKILNVDLTGSVYVGLAVSFSSTIIAMKLIADKNRLDSIYGKISIGVLILQDIVAIFALMIISASSSGTGLGSLAVNSFLTGAGLLVGLSLFGFFLLPKITKLIASSQELLFVFSITWAFGVAALFGVVGFSVEIGALIAGVLLSVSPYSPEIGSKVRPLKDFFLILFFIILGFSIQITNLGEVIVPALILSAVVLIFKPLILMTLSALFKYTKRNNFLIGITLGQVSEFSLVVMALGYSLGQLSQNLVSIVTLAAIITITVSSYLTVFSDWIYSKISRPLSIFEKRGTKEMSMAKKEYDTILFGYNRTGFEILRALKDIKESCLVVDFNPDTISRLSKWGVPVVYGDAYDSDFLSELPLKDAKVIVSTIPDYETNYLIVKKIRAVNKKSIVILRVQSVHEALDLYNQGADYVLSPYVLGGEHIAQMLKDYRMDEKEYRQERTSHIKLLKDVLKSEKGYRKF